MNLTPRNRIQLALRHQQPDRVPFSWGLSPTPEMSAAMEAYLRERGLSWSFLYSAVEDSLRITSRYIGPVLPERTDLWGIVRKPMSYGIGVYNEIEVYPLAEVTSASQVADYPWPDPAWFADELMREDLLKADPEGRLAGKLQIDICGNPLEIYTWMTGHERTFLNMVERPEVVWAGMERITGYFEARMRRCLPRVADRVDICYFADDLGGQKGLLLSPKSYRELIMPFHQRLFKLAKELAPQAAIMFHSDGSVVDLLPDLVEAGVEVLEAVQVDAARMDAQSLKDRFGDCLAFHGGISVQALLPHAEAETVERECRRLVEVFGAGGGYIAAPTHCIQVGTPPENVLAMLRGVLGMDEYEQVLDLARLENFHKTFVVEKPHLFIPIKNDRPGVVLQILQDGVQVREFVAGLPQASLPKVSISHSDSPDWWAYYDLSEFSGERVDLKTIEPSIPAGALAQLEGWIQQGDGGKEHSAQAGREHSAQADDLYRERFRPQFHFTPRRGWNNDPNGMVYQDGTWHLFFQYNPFGVTWGNMHWGHAVSRDLVHWQELPVALYQRSLVDMAFSGGAILDVGNTAGFQVQDEGNEAGLPEPAPMVLSFTSTGRGECLAYSLDGGQTFLEYPGNPLIQHAGRDPKIIWYEPGKKWVMIVYEEIGEERGYAFYDSPDLKAWRRTSFLPGYYECPELFELPVMGNPVERYWVIYGALWGVGGEKSVFSVGHFDGERFTILQEPRPAHNGPHFYASQIFSHAPDDRKVMIGWLMGAAYPGMPFSQGMSLPLELSLERFPGGYQLCFAPVKEIQALRGQAETGADLTVEQANDLLSTPSEGLLEILLSIELEPTQPVVIDLGWHRLTYDPILHEMRFNGARAALPPGASLELHILVDRSVTEIFARMFGANEAGCLGAAAFSGMTTFPPSEVFSSGEVFSPGEFFPPRQPEFKIKKAGIIRSIKKYRIESIWK